VSVRRFTGRDGAEKIQLRVDLGMLQMNAEGRPDGKHPYGHPSLYEHYLSRKSHHEQTKGTNDTEFRLKGEDCSRLQQEAIQYHHRYICLYQLDDYEGVIRDTDRNLQVLEFVDQHAESEELSWSLQQFRPQLLMMRCRARAGKALRDHQHPEAEAVIEAGIDELREFYRRFNRQELMEQSAEIPSLENWLREIRANRPLTEREKLQNALDDAVRREDYETAARCRDALRNLSNAD
jgi:hypothetical protein